MELVLVLIVLFLLVACFMVAVRVTKDLVKWAYEVSPWVLLFVFSIAGLALIHLAGG